MVANMGTTGLVPNKGASTPAVITIPAPNRAITRRSAQNPNVSIYAFVVRDKLTNNLSNVSVSLKRNDRFMGLTLKGHAADIVDLEFLRTTTQDQVHVLASCDTDGVVYLWFLYVAVDALGIEIGLRLLKKYSFYSLRRSTSAFYSRIRLAGTIQSGTMILVPNDGSNCRIVSFNCHTYNPNADEQVAAIEAPPQPKQILAPPDHSSQDEYAKDARFDDDDMDVGHESRAEKGGVSAQGNTISNSNEFALEHSAGVEVVPQAPNAPFATEEDEEELVPAEGKHATEALAFEPKAFVRSASAAPPLSKADESMSEEYMDAISNVISEHNESLGEKVLAEEDKVKNVPQAADVLDYGDLREIAGSDDEGRGDEFSDPEVEFGKNKVGVEEGYEAEGEFEAVGVGGRVNVPAGGFERRDEQLLR